MLHRFICQTLASFSNKSIPNLISSYSASESKSSIKIISRAINIGKVISSGLQPLICCKRADNNSSINRQNKICLSSSTW